MREQDYYVQIEMLRQPMQPGDEIKLDVAIKCPGCESMLWARAHFRFRSLYVFVNFEPVRQCLCCLKKFDDAEGLLPFDRQLRDWMRLSNLYKRAGAEALYNKKDVMWLWRETTIEVMNHIPDNKRSSEKRSRLRKKKKGIWLHRNENGDFLSS